MTYIPNNQLPQTDLLVPGDVFISKNSSEEADEFVLRLDEAAGSSHHGSGQWASHSRGGQELSNVGGEAEWHGSVGIQVARLVINVKFKVGNVKEATVLVQVHHVWVHAAQMQNELHESSQG